MLHFKRILNSLEIGEDIKKKYSMCCDKSVYILKCTFSDSRPYLAVMDVSRLSCSEVF